MSIEDSNLESAEICITRRILDVKKFNEEYCPLQLPKKLSLGAKFRKRFTSLRFETLLCNVFPFYKILASFYTLQLFLADIVAGLTMSILHVPQGMAYGYLAGLKPINGLYTSFFPPLVYFFFGTSRHISVGTFSVVALLSSEPVDRLSDKFVPSNQTHNTTESTADELASYRLTIAVTVTIIAGLIQFSMGLFRLGFLVVYISAPLLGGFTCASALHVLASQLNALFGLRLERFKGPGRLVLTFIDFFRKVRDTNLATLVVSLICITILALFKFLINPFVVKRFPFPLPIELIVLIGGTIVSYFVGLEALYGIRIVGTIPRGLPTPVLPDIQLAPDVLMESFVISFVALATTVSLVKLYAVRGGYDVFYTQEMTALGLANITGGFLRGHAASGALARTSAAVSAGMKSQVASLISCSVLLLVLTVIGPLLESVPLSVLSSIIAVSLTGIFMQITDLPKLYRTSILDMFIWLVAFLATIFLDVPYGLITGLLFSLLTVLYRTQSCFAYELAQVKDTELYADIRYHREAKRIPGLVVLRFGGPLYYANAEWFQNWIIQCTQIDPNKAAKAGKTAKSPPSRCCNGTCFSHSDCKPDSSNDAREEMEIRPSFPDTGATQNELRFIVLDIASWNYVDYVGAGVLRDMIHSFARVDVNLVFTACQPQVRHTLNKSGLSEDELDRICFVSIHDAVVYAKQRLAINAIDGNTQNKLDLTAVL